MCGCHSRCFWAAIQRTIRACYKCKANRAWRLLRLYCELLCIGCLNSEQEEHGAWRSTSSERKESLVVTVQISLEVTVCSKVASQGA